METTQSTGRLKETAVEEKTISYQELLRTALPLQELFASIGYRTIFAGSSAQILHHQFEEITIHDLDILLLNKIDSPFDTAKIVHLLNQNGYSEVKVVTSEELLGVNARRSKFATLENPTSVIVQCKAPQSEVAIEIFLGSYHGSGYQMKGYLDEEVTSIDIQKPGSIGPVTVEVNGNEQSLEALTDAALLSYYCVIGKVTGLISVIILNKDSLDSLVETAIELNPNNRRFFQLFFAGLNARLQGEAIFSKNQELEQILKTAAEKNDPFSVLFYYRLIENFGSENADVQQHYITLSRKTMEDVAKNLLERGTSAQAELAEQIKSVLVSEGTTSAGELLLALEDPLISTVTLLSQLVKEKDVMAAFEIVAEANTHVELAFHGLPHAVDVAVKGIILAVHEKMIDTEKITDETVAIFIALLFHDISIAYAKKYKNHELRSCLHFIQFMENFLSGSDFHVDENKIAACAFAIMGTALTVVDSKLVSMAQLDIESFITRIGTAIEGAEDIGEKDKETLREVVNKIRANKAIYADVNKLRVVFGLADIIGMASSRAAAGKEALFEEVGVVSDATRLKVENGAPAIQMIAFELARRLNAIEPQTNSSKLISYLAAYNAAQNYYRNLKEMIAAKRA